jgi:hypothetical protein
MPNCSHVQEQLCGAITLLMMPQLITTDLNFQIVQKTQMFVMCLVASKTRNIKKGD